MPGVNRMLDNFPHDIRAHGPEWRFFLPPVLRYEQQDVTVKWTWHMVEIYLRGINLRSEDRRTMELSRRASGPSEFVTASRMLSRLIGPVSFRSNSFANLLRASCSSVAFPADVQGMRQAEQAAQLAHRGIEGRPPVRERARPRMTSRAGNKVLRVG
jgi:hypothetical protein